MGGNKHDEIVSRVIERSASIADVILLSQVLCEEAASVSEHITLVAVIAKGSLEATAETLSYVGDKTYLDSLVDDLRKSSDKTSSPALSDSAIAKVTSNPVEMRRCRKGTEGQITKSDRTLHLQIRSNGETQAYLSILSNHKIAIKSEEIELLESLAHVISLIWTTIVTSSPPQVALGSPFDREMLEALDKSGIALAVIDRGGAVVFANDRAHKLAEGSVARRLEDLLPNELIVRLDVTSSLQGSISSGNSLVTLKAVKLWREGAKVRSLRYTLRTVLGSKPGVQEPQLVVMVVDTSALTHLQHQIEHISELILTGTQAAPIAITIPDDKERRHVGSLASEIDLPELYEEIYQRYSTTAAQATPDRIEVDNLSIERNHRQFSLWITFASNKSPHVERGVVLDTTEAMTATNSLRRSIKVSDLQSRFAESCASADSPGELDVALHQLILGLSPEVQITQVAFNDSGMVSDTVTKESLPTNHFILNTLNQSLRNLSVEEIPSFSSSNTTIPKDSIDVERSTVVIPRTSALQAPRTNSQFYYISFTSSSTDLHDHILQVGNLYVNTLRRLALAPVRARLGQIDPTTGLRVARALYDGVEQVQKRVPGAENESWNLVVKLEDADQIQEHFGFDVHEELLKALAETTATVSGGQEVFRVGPSTLVSWIVGINKTHAKRAVLALEKMNRKTVELGGILFALNFKSTITKCEVGLTPKENLSRSLEHHLVAGRSRGLRADKLAIRTSKERLSEVERVVSVLENEHFELYVQPKWSLKLDRPVSFEALLRWPEDELPLIPTQRVISIVESLNLIDVLTSQVIKGALPILKQLREFNSTLTLAINISPMTLNSTKWLTHQQEQLKGDMPLKGIIFEITESVALQHSHKVFYTMKEFANLGTLYSIDDFGTGFTSLQNLTRLPLSELKIDISFIRSVTKSKRSRALVKTQIDIAHSLGIYAVAEGVEDFEQLEAVRKLECDVVQGYLIARPFPASQVVSWLTSTKQMSFNHRPGETKQH